MKGGDTNQASQGKIISTILKADLWEVRESRLMPQAGTFRRRWCVLQLRRADQEISQGLAQLKVAENAGNETDRSGMDYTHSCKFPVWEHRI